MKVVIVYYSKHHENTKQLLGGIKKEYPKLKLIDVSENKVADLSGYDRIGVASGIYCGNFAKPLMDYLKANLPEGKDVFGIYTCARKTDSYTKNLKRLVEKQNGNYLGEYGCFGYGSIGPFKALGGLQKGHPNQEDIQKAVEFFDGILDGQKLESVEKKPFKVLDSTEKITTVSRVLDIYNKKCKKNESIGFSIKNYPLTGDHGCFEIGLFQNEQKKWCMESTIENSRTSRHLEFETEDECLGIIKTMLSHNLKRNGFPMELL